MLEPHVLVPRDDMGLTMLVEPPACSHDLAWFVPLVRARLKEWCDSPVSSSLQCSAGSREKRVKHGRPGLHRNLLLRTPLQRTRSSELWKSGKGSPRSIRSTQAEAATPQAAQRSSIRSGAAIQLRIFHRSFWCASRCKDTHEPSRA